MSEVCLNVGAASSDVDVSPVVCTLRYEECKEKLVPFLKKVGFNPKKDIHFMPCSGLTGANLKEPTDMCSWYT